MIQGPPPFLMNFNPQQGMQPQLPQALAQILQQRQQQGAQQQPPMQQMQALQQNSSTFQPQGSGVTDIAGMMGWKPDTNASQWDNKIAAFQHIVSSLGF